MSTILARQLKRFNFHRGFDSQGPATLLYDAKRATHFTAEDAFEIGLTGVFNFQRSFFEPKSQGFEVLCEMDRRFLPFRQTLFHSVPKEREQLTVEELEELTQPISSFLKLLTDYFMFPAATKALEHLVRNYRIHVYYVNECMACCLLYHSTVEFQNFIRIMNLKETTIWYWLEDLQKSRLPLTRDILVKRCITDQSIFGFICSMAKWSAEEQFRNERIYPFFAVLICEVLHHAPQISEELMRQLMSTIAAGLQPVSPVDFRKAVHMIIVQLCTKASLSEKAISAMLQSLVLSSEETEALDLLTIMSHVYKTQNHYTKAPGKFLKLLGKLRGLGEAMRSLMERGLDTKRFLKILLPKLIKRVTKGADDLDALLTEFLVSVPLSDHITDLIAYVFQVIKTKEEEEIKLLRHIVKSLDVHYPVLMDEALNDLLSKGVNQELKTKLLNLFYGSPHEVLHWSIPGFDLSLLAAADAPVPEARKSALLELQKMDSDQRRENFQFIEKLLIRRLQDDDLAVACAAVECKIEEISDSESLLSSLLALLDRCMEHLKNTETPDITSTALKLVDLISCQESLISDSVCCQLLDFLFPHCCSQMPISVKIGSWFGNLKQSVVSLVTSDIDWLSLESKRSTEAHINKVLIENLLLKAQQETEFTDVLSCLLEKCGIRVCCFALLSLQHHFNHKKPQQSFASALICLLKKIESYCDGEIANEVVELTKGVSVSFLETFLDTLRTLLEVEDESSLDDRTIKSCLVQILKLSQYDKNRSCVKAAIQSFAQTSQFCYLVNFLLSPELATNVHLLKTGLDLVDHYLSNKEITTEELVNCVFLLEYSTSIEGDSDIATSLLSGMFASYNEKHHKPKKQKTGIKASVGSVNCAEIQEHFMKQLRILNPVTHYRVILMIIRSVKDTADNMELLDASKDILRFYTNNRDALIVFKPVKLIQNIVSLFTPGVLETLDEEKSNWMKILIPCLELDANSAWIGVRYSVLKHIQTKWIKSGSMIPNELFEAVLKLSHHDQDEKNCRLASSVTKKWPLRILSVHYFLNMAFETNSEKQDLCLWTLEICKSTIDVLEKLIETEKEFKGTELDIGTLVEFLKEAPDPVLQQSVLSLLQQITSKAPGQALDYITPVLEILGKQFTEQEEELGLQRMTEAIGVMVQPWTSAELSTMSIWLAMKSSITTLKPHKQMLVCQSVLSGMSNKAKEGLSTAILAFRRDISMNDPIQYQNWTSLSIRLCQMVNVDVQNEALALAMRTSEDEADGRVYQSIPRSIVELVYGRMKISIPVSSICYESSQEVSKGLGFNLILTECTRQLSLLTKMVANEEEEDEEDNSKQKSEIKSAKKTLQKLDTTLKHIMDVNSYLITLINAMKDIRELTQLILHLQFIKRRLREFDDKDFTKVHRLSTDVLLICPFFHQMLLSDLCKNETALQLMLEIIQQLVQSLAAQQPDSFLDLLPVVSSFTKDPNSVTRNSRDAALLSEEINNSLELMAALIEGLGSFISPYLEKILYSLLHPKMKETAVLRDSILEMIPKHIPVRLLLPQLLPLYAQTQQPILHLKLTKEMILVMSNSVASQFSDQLLNFLFDALDLIHSSQNSLTLEGHAIEAFISFVMKLSERQFKPIFTALMDWSQKDSEEGVLSRQISCFRLFGELTRKLKSLFVGYYPAFLDKMFEILTVDDKKKLKQHQTRDSYYLDLYIMRCLYRGLQYDEQDIFSTEITKRMISIALKYIQKRKTPDLGFMEEEIETESTARDIQFTGMEFCKTDELSITIVALLVQCGVQSSFQKIVNHKTLKACSKGLNYGRALCLSVVREMILQLKEEYCVLIPESIPSLVEMLEVEDQRVSKICKDIMRLLADLSGDDNLEHYF
eukprot:g3646.t1